MGLSAQPDLAAPSERSRLLAAIASECEDHGYAETTVAAVANRAGLTEEDFHRHFKSTEECAVEAVRGILGEAMGAISSQYSPDLSERESALRALLGILELFAARPAQANLAMVHSRQMMPPEAFALHEAGFAILRSMLDRLREDKASETEPPACAARGAIGGGEAIVRREILAGNADRLPQFLPELVYTALVPFLGCEEAARLAREARELVTPRA